MALSIGKTVHKFFLNAYSDADHLTLLNVNSEPRLQFKGLQKRESKNCLIDSKKRSLKNRLICQLLEFYDEPNRFVAPCRTIEML